jgi:hypothetical protein
MEYRMPQRIVSDSYGVTDLTDTLGKDARNGLLLFGMKREQVVAEGMPDETHWILVGEVFSDYGRGRDIEGPHGTFFIPVDEQGRAITPPGMMAFCDDDERAKDQMLNVMTLFNPALLAISFLHCKNVALEDHTVDRPLAKKHRLKYGREPVAYKTLVIEPLKQILRTEGRSDEHGVAKAMHICRGHFADYRNGRGLFGKYKQMVWIPQVLRGGQKGDKAAPREMEIKV